jgi:hypothetical protein
LNHLQNHLRTHRRNPSAHRKPNYPKMGGFYKYLNYIRNITFMI